MSWTDGPILSGLAVIRASFLLVQTSYAYVAQIQLLKSLIQLPLRAVRQQILSTCDTVVSEILFVCACV